MTWKFAACRVPYVGAKAGVRFDGDDRAAIVAAYRQAVEPYRDVFVTGPDRGTFPSDFLDGKDDPIPHWARVHSEGHCRALMKFRISRVEENSARAKFDQLRKRRADWTPGKSG